MSKRVKEQMSNVLLEKLNISLDDAKAILNNKPSVLDPLYWHRSIDAYFIPGKRKNALVQCGNGDWKSSTRYNEELDNPDMFIPLLELQDAVSESAPF